MSIEFSTRLRRARAHGRCVRECAHGLPNPCSTSSFRSRRLALRPSAGIRWPRNPPSPCATSTRNTDYRSSLNSCSRTATGRFAGRLIMRFRERCGCAFLAAVLLAACSNMPLTAEDRAALCRAGVQTEPDAFVFRSLPAYSAVGGPSLGIGLGALSLITPAATGAGKATAIRPRSALPQPSSA